MSFVISYVDNKVIVNAHFIELCVKYSVYILMLSHFFKENKKLKKERKLNKSFYVFVFCFIFNCQNITKQMMMPLRHCFFFSPWPD